MPTNKWMLSYKVLSMIICLALLLINVGEMLGTTQNFVNSLLKKVGASGGAGIFSSGREH